MELTKKERAFQEVLLDWAEGNYREFPWRAETDPYRIFIAEVLLQRTLATKVVPIYTELLNRYPDFDALADADQEDLSLLLRPLGLQNHKAKAFIDIGTRLRDNDLPSEENELLSLPFVGRYAAYATLCFAFGQSQAIVDVNVVRIYDRVFNLGITDATSDELWEFAQRLVPGDEPEAYNLALLDFGAEICTARNPGCDGCPENERCLYYRN